MKEIISKKSELADIEFLEQDLIEKQQEISRKLEKIKEIKNKKMEEIKNEGIFYYTKDKRQELIDTLIKNKLPQQTVKELEEISDRWENGEITYIDVKSFYEFEIRFTNVKVVEANFIIKAKKFMTFLNGGK